MSTGTNAILVGAPVTATGGLLFADLDAALPADAVTPVDPSFIKGGYIGDGGVTRTTDASDEKIRAWGGDTVKIVRTEHSITYTFQFMESANADLLKLIHGEANVIITPATVSTGTQIEVRQTKKIPPRKAFVLDMMDDPSKLREVVPDGQITTSGDVVFVHSDAIRYEVTIEAFPVTVDGTPDVKAISYIDDGVFAAA